MIAEAIVTAFCLLTAWGILFFWIPEMTRAYALTRLHDLRDNLYAAAVRAPALRETSFYRDLEFMYVSSIHLARDRSWRDSVDFFIVEKQRVADTTRTQARAAIYIEEMDACFGSSSSAEVGALMHDFSRRDLALVIRIAFGHPVAAFFSVVGVFAIIAWVKLVQSAGSLPEAAARIERAPHRSVPFARGMAAA